MSFPPFDPSAPSHNRCPQLVPQGYNSYDQPPYGHMGFADMSQSGQRYHPQQAPYPTVQPGAHSGSGEYDSYGPSYSPTAAQFVQSAQHGTLPTPNSDPLTYAPRPRHHSVGAVSASSDPRYRAPRRQSGEERMGAVEERLEFVPSQQVPSQPYYDTARPAPLERRSSNGHSTASALALEKPYVCDLCQTRFARHHDCKRHRETHVVNASGEKPHHCVVCGKSFTRKDALKRHTNQKGCDINAGSHNFSSQSSRSSSSSSPQQVPGTFYPVGNLPHSSGGYY